LGLGLVHSRLRVQTGASVSRGLGFAAAIWSFEVLTLPLIGATPRLAAWPRGEVLLLAAHTASYAFGAELASALMFDTRGRRWGISS
jgi:hypothetical protein